MAKGYLYDNGYELISREEALPDTSEASEGDILSLNSDKEAEWVTPESELKNTILLKVDVSSDKLRFTPYSPSGDAIKVGDILDYADDNGMVVCRLVPTNGTNHKYTGNVTCIFIAEDVPGGTQVGLMIPFVWTVQNNGTNYILYLTSGYGTISSINKTASNFTDSNTEKIVIPTT